jgi:hypothetical protein
MTYRERRFEGTRTFVLEGSILKIKGKQSLKSEFDSRVDLSHVSPRYNILRVRHRLFFVAVFLFAIAFGLGWYLDKLLVSSGALILAAILAVVSARKSTFFQFLYESGGVAFDVCKAGPDKDKCEGFVEATVKTIEESGDVEATR